jgi:hypothetical protein
MFKWFKTEDGTLCNLDYAIQISVQTTNDSKFAIEAHLESGKNVCAGNL